jgi:hypothetical protein
MRRSILKLALFLFCCTGSISVYAATITSVVVSPSTVRVGEPVTITINGDGENANCGIRLQFSDAIPTESFSLADRGGTLPLILSKTFDKVGTFKIEALGRKAGALTFGCRGEAATTLTVVAAGARLPAAAVGSSATLNAQCPPGWEMISGQKDPSKGFTCAPLRPATRIQCGSGLSYFESDGLIGCKKRR